MEDRNNLRGREVQQIDISRRRPAPRQSNRPTIRENQPHRMDVSRPTGSRRTGSGTASGRTTSSRSASDAAASRRSTTGSRTTSNRPTGTRTTVNRPTGTRSVGSRNTGYGTAGRRPMPSQRSNYNRGYNSKNRRRRRRRSGRGTAGMGILLLLLVLLGCVGFLYGRVRTSYTLEAGNMVDPAELVRYGGKVPTVTEALTEEQMHTPGEYTVKVKLSPFSYKVKVTVADTISPAAQVQKVYGLYGESLSPELFVTEIRDGSNVTVTYEAEPDFQKAGVQEVKLLLTDKGGNITRLSAELVVSNLKRELVWEAGNVMPAADAFLEDIAGFENTQISYVTDPATVDTSVLGSVEIKVLLDGNEAVTFLNIVDTVAPVITVQRVEGWVGKAIDISKFVDSMTEATDVTYSYVQEPDWTKEGSGSTEIIVSDAAGNTVQETVSYTLQKDTTAPEVAVSSIDIIIGEPVSYKKAVGYSDNCDSQEELKLEIDNSKVDPNTVGEYEVTYTVTDTAGNVTKKAGKVFVMAEQPVYYDEAVINAEADKVLAEILTDGMSQEEKARAIYNWVHSHIGYINHSEKGDWKRGAYEGLVERQGDCYAYACTSKALLTRAGITNMDIVKSTVNPSHYWNLVDVGNGWYHFDATPRKDKTIFFMWTDEELREYSESHSDSHIYDAEQYPEIN